ncbi:hypothetical protein AB6R86_004620 [Salmonella enterica]
MSKEKGGGVSVYISPDIVAALEAKQKERVEAMAKVGLDPLCYVPVSIGWLVRSELRQSLNLHSCGVE